jgi:hypothetical protein
MSSAMGTGLDGHAIHPSPRPEGPHGFGVGQRLGKSRDLWFGDSSEIPMRHRAEIYSRNGLRERLSIVTEQSGAGLLAINLFCHESQPAFSDEEIDHVRCASPLILACVERHVALHRPESTGRGTRHASPG